MVNIKINKKKTIPSSIYFVFYQTQEDFGLSLPKALRIFSAPQYPGDILGKKWVLYAVPATQITSAFTQRMAFSICNYRPIHYSLVHLLQKNTPMYNHETMYFITPPRGTFTEGLTI